MYASYNLELYSTIKNQKGTNSKLIGTPGRIEYQFPGVCLSLDFSRYSIRPIRFTVWYSIFVLIPTSGDSSQPLK